MKITELKQNKDNPRTINKANLRKLIKSIKDFPGMMKLRPIVVDNNNIVLGGNMRLKALKEIGYKDIPDEWVVRADELTDEQKKEFIIKDNVGFGEWDTELLQDTWDISSLNDWGVELAEKVEQDILDEPEIEFSEELLLEHNYVVLYFDNQYDWNTAVDKLGLVKVKSNIKTQKSQKVGIGRVIKGKDIIEKL